MQKLVNSSSLFTIALLASVFYISAGHAASKSPLLIITDKPSAPAQMPQKSETDAKSDEAPFVKILFEKPSVNYEESVFAAVNQAHKKLPQSRFEIMAVHPVKVNGAETAIETTRAHRHAEEVVDALVQKGLPQDLFVVTDKASETARTSEVQIFIR